MNLITELETSTLIIGGIVFIVFFCIAKWLIDRNADKYYNKK